MARWPLSPSAWIFSCSSSQPLGVMEPTGSGAKAGGASPALGAVDGGKAATASHSIRRSIAERASFASPPAAATALAFSAGF